MDFLDISLKSNENQALGFLFPIPRPQHQQGGLPVILVVTPHPLESTEAGDL